MYRVVILCALAASAASSFLPQVEFTALEPYSEWNGGSNAGFSGIGVYAGNYQGAVLSEKGAQLASIARSSASSAKSAAYSQNSASSHAEYGVKSNLVGVAIGAAKTAQAALTGKQAIFVNLKNQLITAQHQFKEELVQYHQTKIATQAAEETAHKAQIQINTLRAALAEAEKTAHNAAAAAAEAGNAEAAQKEMVYEAKQRIEGILSQLKYVAGDLKDIEYSASKATKAAQVANFNAVNSGQKNVYFGYHI